MKTKIWIPVISIVLIASVVGSFIYYTSLTEPSQSDSSDIPSNPGNQLVVNNLSTFPDGQVSFNVTLDDYESSIIEGVIVNGERYSWSDGSQEDPSISKNETKQWSVDIGNFEENHEIQIVVETSTGSTSANATVIDPTPGGSTTPEPNYPNGSTPADPNVDPQTSDNQTLPDYVYDFYGGVNLFSEGIHVIATSQDPRTLFSEYENINDYWKMLLEHEITQATDQDFISIILSRGDKPTGGYNIQIENFAWLESYPVKFLFQVNFTDPGEGVATTDALTNPLVLVPIGKLTTGEYHIEVPIAQYILNFDEEGNPYYTQILTFAPVIWEETLTIRSTEDPADSTIFKVTLNGNEAPDLIVQVDLSDGINEEEAKMICEVAFNQTLGVRLHRLDTITFNDEQIISHYTWGYDENDMGHVFDLIADIANLKLTINHCR
jgi:hypothetical protein